MKHEKKQTCSFFTSLVCGLSTNLPQACLKKSKMLASIFKPTSKAHSTFRCKACWSPKNSSRMHLSFSNVLVASQPTANGLLCPWIVGGSDPFASLNVKFNEANSIDYSWARSNPHLSRAKCVLGEITAVCRQSMNLHLYWTHRDCQWTFTVNVNRPLVYTLHIRLSKSILVLYITLLRELENYLSSFVQELI